jgi:hydrogenase-4 transcriptional activator
MLPPPRCESASIMTSSLRLQDVLTAVTEGLVMETDGAFARIWLVGPGDICHQCFKVDLCPSRLQCLHVKASSGISTNLNGEYCRVPIGWGHEDRANRLILGNPSIPTMS